jgi:hypothetical protein
MPAAHAGYAQSAIKNIAKALKSPPMLPSGGLLAKA